MKTDDERAQEIGERFAAKGWTLRLAEEGGRWVASFNLVVPTEIGYAPTFAREVTGRTKLEAAEAAWAEYVQRN